MPVFFMREPWETVVLNTNPDNIVMMQAQQGSQVVTHAEQYDSPEDAQKKMTDLMIQVAMLGFSQIGQSDE